MCLALSEAAGWRESKGEADPHGAALGCVSATSSSQAAAGRLVLSTGSNRATSSPKDMPLDLLALLGPWAAAGHFCSGCEGLLLPVF